MKPHDTFLELAAVAIDFPLTASERGRLDGHLAGCAACVRTVAGLHEDVLAMESLPPVVLPERREAEILGSVLHPQSVSHPMRLVVVAALLGLLLIGTLIAGSEIIRRANDNDLVVVPPLPNQTAEPDASAEPRETGPIVPVGELAWEQVGSLPEGVGGLFAVSGGYVTYVEPGYPTGPSARFSSDGRTWSDPVPLAAQHLNCPGWGPDGDDYAPDAEVRGGSSNGREVVLFGREQLFTDEACTNPGSSFRMMTWVSSDGRTWERSQGFGDPGSEAAGAWPTADGWQLVGGSPAGSAIWASTDGIRWSPAGMEAGAPNGVGPPAAAAGPTVVGVPQSPEEDSSLGLSVWTDGSWTPAALPDECPKQIEIVLAPASWDGARWLISGGTTVCSSEDLEQWTAAELEDSYPSTISLVAGTRYGFIAVSSCQDRTCDGEFALRISPDGRTWTPLASPMHATAIAEGRAGVLAVDGDGGIWRLTDTGLANQASPVPSADVISPRGVLAVTHGSDSDAPNVTFVDFVNLPAGDAPYGTGFGADPAWGPDGLFVYACAKELGQNTTICTLDTGNLGESEPEIAYDATHPVAAPDGKRIVIHRGAIDVGETWTMGIDGSDARRLATGSFLQWSPDGAWLLGQPESPTFEVAIISAAGGDPRVLAPGYDPAWSPNGQRIVYAVVDGDATLLRQVDVATRGIEDLYAAPAGSDLAVPAYLPDGGWVFVLDGDLWRLDPGTGQSVTTQLTTGLDIQAAWSGDALDVSPDGRWVAFSTGGGGDARVGIAATDGAGWEMLQLGEGPMTQPKWAPEGTVVRSSAAPDEDQLLGTVWTNATVPVVADRPSGRIEAVTAGGPGFVAVGRGCDTRCEAIVLTSVDGRSWERAPASDALDSTLIVRMSGPELGMFDVAAGSPGVVAIGYSARTDIETTIWFSPDGTTWERMPIGDTEDVRLSAVTWTGSRFVIVGEDRPAMQDAQDIAAAKARAAVWTSTDGRTWAQVPHTDALEVGGFIDTMEDPTSGGMHDVTGGLGGVVAVGSVCDADPASCEVAAWTSPDGITWGRVAEVPTISGRLVSVAAEQANEHDADRVPYVAVGTDTCAAGSECPGLVMTSSDGTSWMRQPFEQPGDLQTATLVGDRFLTTFEYGPEPIWASDSGTSWAPAEMQGGPGARTDIANPLFADTSATAVWLATLADSNDPVAWVSTSGQP